MSFFNLKITKGKIGWWLLVGLLGGLLCWQIGSIYMVYGFILVVSILTFWRYGLKGFALLMIFVAAMGIGYLRTIPLIPKYNPDHIAHQIGRGEQFYEIEVKGTVQTSVTDVASFSGRVSQNGREFYGDVWMTGRFSGKLLHGDVISVIGPLERSLYYKNYPAAMSFPDLQGIEAGEFSITRTLLSWRRNFIERINARIGEPCAALLSGILVGNKSGYTKEIKQALSQVGLAHIVVVSGMHLLIVVAALQKSLSKLLAHKKATIILMLSILLFVVFTGAAPSTIRAGFMAALVILLPLFARGKNPARVLLVTAILAFLWDPTLQSNLGFQLSFAATAGILFTRHYWESILSFLPSFGQIRTVAALTCAAQVAVAPLLFVYFENLAWIAPLINVIVAPLLPYIMLSGLLLVIVPGFLANTMQLTALLVSWPIIKIADMSDRIFGWSFTMKISTALIIYLVMIGIYYLMIKIPLWKWRRERKTQSITHKPCLVS
ncbi:ComEC/Rec2 family competence protein [Patescibacteria group bacterium]